ncbi:MAG: hypothetical protein AAFX02_05600 [Pseudomonadota bacterium]
MSRFLIAGAVALLGLGSMSQAQAQTQQCQNSQVAGAVVGGLAGGVLGGAIASDRRGFRRGGYYGRGYYGRGYGRGFRRGNRGAGIVIGALAGSLIGSQLARTSNDCVTQRQYTQTYDPYAGDPTIDQNARRLGDPYGGQRNVGYQQTGRVLSGGPVQQQVPQPQQQQTVPTECRLTEQVTNLPDGSQAVDQIQVCRELPNGAWYIMSDQF